MVDIMIELLIDCLRKDRAAETIRALGTLSDADWDNLVETSSRHGITPILYFRVQPLFAQINIPPRVEERLRSTYLSSAARNAQFFHELAKVLQSLKDSGIPVICLKGAHLAWTVYGNIALRPMGDFDLLVREEDIGRAGGILPPLGYAPTGYVNIDEMIPVLKHLPRFVKPGGPDLELHWRLVSPEHPLAVDMEGLWQRAEKSTIQGIETRVLSPEDLLLHLCEHSCFHHLWGYGLKALCDIAQTIDYYGTTMDWRALTDRARQWNAGRIVYVTLAMAHKMLGSAVPEAVLETLQPPCADREAMTALAEELVFSEPSPLTRNAAVLWDHTGRYSKLGALMRGMFPSREVMASMYPVSASSPRMFLYYPVRMKDLLFRYRRHLIKLFMPDSALVASATIRNKGSRFQDWLLEDGSPANRGKVLRAAADSPKPLGL
jgi:hypothetical protein